MRTSTRRVVTLFGAVAIAAGALSTSALPAAANHDSLAKKAAEGKFRATVLNLPSTAGGVKSRAATAGTARLLPTLSGAIVEAAKTPPDLDARGLAGDTGPAADSGASSNSLGVGAHSLGCRNRNSDGNVRVNQDCTFRRQAEEIIKFNPADPSNLIASQNDSRIGFNHCGFDYSFDGGTSWGDGQPPFWQHTNEPLAQVAGAGDPNQHTIAPLPGTDHTYDAASDPIQAFDSRGRAFFGCVVFDINTFASGLFVTQSPIGAGGSFYDNVPNVAFDAMGNPRPGVGRRFIVAEDNNPQVFHDKPFLTADAFKDSPNRDNVYVTWTVFMQDPTGAITLQSPIFGSMSTDHALTWSTPEEISGNSPTLCFFGDAFDPTESPHDCNFDQGSDPIVLPNGEVEVIFNNGNTAASNPNSQQLGVHCKPSGSSPTGTAHLNCANPVKVGNDQTVGEPVCDFGRGPEECIPGAFIRTNDFPRIAINRGNGHLYATWQDFRDGEFDIQLSQSLDGGLTWQEAGHSVNPDRGKDHYFPAIDVITSGKFAVGEDNDRNGDHVAVSYFRTDGIPNESEPLNCLVGAIPKNCIVFTPGVQPGAGQQDSDYDLSGGMGLDTPFAAERISPRFRPPDGAQRGFNGDYSGLTVVGDTAHPVWSDTRNVVPQEVRSQPPGQGVTHDEDIFTTARPVPNGHDERTES